MLYPDIESVDGTKWSIFSDNIPITNSCVYFDPLFLKWVTQPLKRWKYVMVVKPSLQTV